MDKDSLSINIDDFEPLMKGLSGKVPFMDSEMIYMSELDTQAKIYMGFGVIGVMFFILALVL